MSSSSPSRPTTPVVPPPSNEPILSSAAIAGQTTVEEALEQGQTLAQAAGDQNK